MAFTETEIVTYTAQLEQQFWSRHRPPLKLRDKIREGQRFSGLAIELFFVLPAFERRGEFIEQSIARLRYVRRHDVWRIYWMRADLKWHLYPPCPEVASLDEALRIVGEDANCCFFG